METRALVAAAVMTLFAGQPAVAQTASDQSKPPAAEAPEATGASPAEGTAAAGGQAVLPPVVITESSEAPPRAKPAKKAKAKPKKAAVKPVAAPAAPPPEPEVSEADVSPPPAAEAGARAKVGGRPLIGSDFAAQTSLSAAEINATSGATLTHGLETKPGLSGSVFAPGANRPIVRGLDNNRVRVQENGIGAGDVSDLSEDHALPIATCGIDGVSVIRGPAGLLYTGKVVGGVVNAETQLVPSEMPRGGFASEIHGGLSSVDEGRDGCFRTTAGAGGFVAHGEAFARKSDDYDTPQGRQLNSFVDSSGYALGGSFVGYDGHLGVAFSRFESVYGIPGAEVLEERSQIDLGQDKIRVEGEWRPGDFGIAAVRGAFGYSDYAHNEVATDVASGDSEIGSRFLNKEYEGRVEVEQMRQATALGVLSGVAGVQLSTRDLTGLSFEGDNLLEPNTTTKTAGFLLQELQLSERLKVSGSVRVEHAEISGATFADFAAVSPELAEFERNFTSTSGGLGLLYQLPLGVTARLSWVYSERAPEAQELFSKGAHEATGTFEIGNPDLKEEKANAFELGFRRDTGSVRFDTSVYYNAYQDFIFRQLTGETCDDTLDSCTPLGGGSELDQVVFGQRDARFYGVEFSGEVDVARVWNGVWGLSAQYDFVRATFNDGGFVPRIPPHRLGGGIYYRDAAWQASVNVLHAFEQDNLADGETPTDGYTLLSSELSHTVRLSDYPEDARELTIGLRGENLLDDEVRYSTSFLKDEVLQPGRSVRLFGRLKF